MNDERDKFVDTVRSGSSPEGPKGDRRGTVDRKDGTVLLQA